MSREIKFRAWDLASQKMLGDMSYTSVLSLNEHLSTVDQMLMQYTGLKDKNGIEIYEGDIIRSTWNHNTFVVEWGEGGFEWFPDCDSNANPHNYRYGGTEVIGNIYENPELLEK